MPLLLWGAHKAKEAVRDSQELNTGADRLVAGAARGEKPDSAVVARLEKDADRTLAELREEAGKQELAVAGLTRRLEDAATPLGKDIEIAREALRRQLLAEINQGGH